MGGVDLGENIRGENISSRRVGGSAARFSLARNPTRPWLACFMHGKELRWLVVFKREYEGLSAEVVHEHLLIRRQRWRRRR